MKVRNTHCIELSLTPAELAHALGHGDARMRSIDLEAKDGQVAAIHIVLEYVIATRGLPRLARVRAADASEVAP